MPYFNPTINFNMLQYDYMQVAVFTSQEVSNYLSNLLAGLLVDFKDPIIFGRSQHIMHIIFYK